MTPQSKTNEGESITVSTACEVETIRGGFAIYSINMEIRTEIQVTVDQAKRLAEWLLLKCNDR